MSSIGYIAFMIWLLTVSTEVGAASWELVQADVCRGKKVLSGHDQFAKENDHFAFVAVRRVWMKDGIYRTNYQLAPQVRPGRTTVYEGGRYFVEWQGVSKKLLRDHHTTMVRPFFDEFRYSLGTKRESLMRELDRWSRYRFVMFRYYGHAMVAKQYSKEKPRLKDTKIVIYNKTVTSAGHLKIEAIFTCKVSSAG